MALRYKHGLGRTPAQDALCQTELFGGFFDFTNCWTALVPSTLAVPGAPTGSALTTAPASGADAQSTVDTLLNQQLTDQQALNATAVQSSALDQAASGAVSVASVATSPLLWVGLLGLGVFALVAMGGGSPRRYGR